MDTSQSDTQADVSALAWVQEELRKVLDSAHKALRRTLRETESTFDSDLDDVEPTVLRAARQHLHQGVGVLDLVGLPAGAVLLRSSEALVQRYIAKPHKLDIAAVEAIERASFALLDLLARRLGGRAVSTVALFPQYRAVQELVGAERVHPADLWPQDWQWRSIAIEADVAARSVDAAAVTDFEGHLLGLMRGSTPDALERLSAISAGFATGATHAHSATLWRLAAGYFEAQAHSLFTPDVYSKRLGSRLLAQLRAQQKGDAAAGERLAQDLLFFCIYSREPAHGQAPRLAAVRHAYCHVGEALPPDYNVVTLGRFDPAWVAQAKKRVLAAKDSWSAVAGGEMHRLSGLSEQFGLVADSLKRLVPGGDRLADAIMPVITQSVHTASTPQPALAMELATSMLYLEAALEDGSFDHAEQAPRVKRLAERIDAVFHGAKPQALETWMEELYRRVSDRQTMGSVVHELRRALSESEKAIDQFFRAPGEPAVLMPVPTQLQVMRGVLSVLGLEQAMLAVLRMREDVDALVAAGEDARHQQPLFERLAGNLSALSFLIDLLGVQPQLAKSMFRFDATSGLLAAQMSRHTTPLEDAAATRLEPTLIAQAQALASSAASLDTPLDQVARELKRLSHEPEVLLQAELAASLSSAQAAIDSVAAPFAKRRTEASAREQVADALADFVATASDPVGLEAAPPVSAPLPLMSLTPAAVESTGLEADPEMREIFLEEAREVLETARVSLRALEKDPSSVEQLTTLRRAFHTFKGSSRMLGLGEFGDASWSCEQLYNAALATQKPATTELLQTTDEALDFLSGWVEAIAAGNTAGWQSAPLCRVADSLRISGRFLSLESARSDAPAPTSAPISFVLPMDQPGAADAEAPMVEPTAAPEREPVPDAAAFEPVLELDFRFDLGDVGSLPETVGSDDGVAALEAAESPAEFTVSQAQGAFDEVAAPKFDALNFEAFDAAENALSPKPFEGAEFETPVEAIELVDSRSSAEDFEVAFTMAMELSPAEAAEAGLFSEPTITTLELDMPESEAGAPMRHALPIESLRSTVPAAPDFEEASANEVFDEGVPAAETLGFESEQPTIEAGAWAEALQPLPPSHTAAPAQDAGWLGAGAEPQARQPEAEDSFETPAPQEAYNEQVKMIGPLQVGIPLFNIYLNEADELSRRLGNELSEWALELQRPVGEIAIALAHSLAGSSATVGFTDLSSLARQLEHALMHSQTLGRGRADDARLFNDVADEVRRLLHQFAAGFLKSASRDLLDRVNAYEIEMAQRLELMAAAQHGEEQHEALATAPTSVLASVALVPAPAEPELGSLASIASAATASQVKTEPVSLEPALSEPLFESEPEPEPEFEPQAALLELLELPELSEPSAASDVPEAPERPESPEVFEMPEVPAVQPLAATAQPVPPEPLRPTVFCDLGQSVFHAFVPPTFDAPSKVSRAAFDSEEDLDSVDVVDADLFPFFEEEALELLPQLSLHLRDWTGQPGALAHATAAMRTLHTLKGGARLAGAMRLGELAHRLETAIEHLVAREAATAVDIEQLLDRADGMGVAFEALRQRDAAAYAAAPHALAPLVDTPDVHVVNTAWPPLDEATPAYEPSMPRMAEEPAWPPAVLQGSPHGRAHDEETAGRASPSVPQGIDWARFKRGGSGLPLAPAERARLASASAVRVRTQLLDRLVNQAGEVSIARARLEAEIAKMKGSLGDLTDNLERLRQQLRDIELQAETQMSTRLEAAKFAAQSFDPLEFDRFTRFQELTRMMAESVNDVATVQRTLQRTLETAEDQLAVQTRLTRDLQDDLLRTRMVEFEGLSERLYRVVRQAAKETGKQVRLDIVGGSIEVDRGVLDRMTGAFEHLLRNCITHGIESPARRSAAGKEPVGSIVVALRQEGNEVSVEFRDDGAGLDLGRIRAKGVANGLIEAHATPSDADLANLIFMPGFSTAESITELAGRGVGMDVVRSEVNALGGRIETASAAGQGTSFKLVLPLTTAVTQVVRLRCGDVTVAVPSTLVELVRRATPAEIEAAYASGTYTHAGHPLPFFWIGALLQLSARGTELQARSLPVVVVRSAQQRIVLHVDEVLGNQEVVVKNLGPQLSRLPGLAGVTLLASGAVSLIYNPVALATFYGDAARSAMVGARDAEVGAAPSKRPAIAALRAPLVLVVDDSLTVRRVTQRLLAREGYRVTLAKDGLDALERLAEERPAVVLSDIEMPRMDGFDLVRNMRSDPALSALPVIMITSRIAQKHRDYAVELGVNHYLGKPYGEEELLALVSRYCTALA